MNVELSFDFEVALIIVRTMSVPHIQVLREILTLDPTTHLLKTNDSKEIKTNKHAHSKQTNSNTVSVRLTQQHRYLYLLGQNDQ